MLRTLVVTATLTTGLLLAGCGSGGGDAADTDSSPAAEASTSETAGTTYLVRADTDAINKVGARAAKALRTAQVQKRIDVCNAASDKGYAAWRRCWHGLLDPVATSLHAMSTTMGDFAHRDFPQACSRSFERASKTFTTREEAVSKLVSGIDSDTRAAQERSMSTYTPTLEKMGKTWTKPFQALTQVCYSPQDLESINASPSPGATATP